MKYLTATMVAGLLMLLACGLFVSGVFFLWGRGPALIAAAVPPMLVALVLLRGVRRAE